VLEEVRDILTELISDLRLSSLSVCGCTVQDIIALVAITLKVVINSALLSFSYAHVRML
jgi:hypothetical protein